jgi:polygalacturonase
MKFLRKIKSIMKTYFLKTTFSKMDTFFALIAVSLLLAGTILTHRTSPPPKDAPTIQEESTPSPYLSQPLAIDTPFMENMIIDEPVFPDTICSIDDFGAVAGGVVSNTKAIERAIESCSDAGGGKVLVPSGTWLTGPIRLRSNIELHVERDATILFSTNHADYLPVVFSRFEGIEYYNYSPPIYAEGVTNVAITGVGTLNGQGNLAWWSFTPRATPSIKKLYAMGDDDIPVEKRIFGTKEAALRPTFIECVRCHNVLIENVKIVNGPMWTIHPLYSDHVIIRGVDVATNPGPSTDGVVVDSSSHVLIENSTFNTGDDAIVLKSGRDKDGRRVNQPTENIVIRDCTIKDSHGAIAIGSEMSGDVRNIFVTDITIGSSQYGFRVKATRGRGGVVENIWVQDMTMRSISIGAIQLTTDYGYPFRPDSVDPPTFRNIHFKNITVQKASQAIDIQGLPEVPIENISFDDTSFYTTKDSVDMRRATDIHITNAKLTAKKDYPMITISNSKQVSIRNTPCQASMNICFSLHGETSEDIDIQGNTWGDNKILVSNEVPQDALHP